MNKNNVKIRNILEKIREYKNEIDRLDKSLCKSFVYKEKNSRKEKCLVSKLCSGLFNRQKFKVKIFEDDGDFYIKIERRLLLLGSCDSIIWNYGKVCDMEIPVKVLFDICKWLREQGFEYSNIDVTEPT